MSNLFFYWIVAATSSVPLPPPFKPFPRRWMAQKSDQKSQLQNAGLTDMEDFFERTWQLFHAISLLRVLWPSWLQFIYLSQVVYTCSGLCPTTFLTNAWPNLKNDSREAWTCLTQNLPTSIVKKRLLGWSQEWLMSSWFVTVILKRYASYPLLTKLSLSKIIQVLMNGTCFFCAGFYCIPLSPQHTDDRWLIDPKTFQQRRSRRANAYPCYTEAPRSASFQPLPQWDMPSRHILVDRSGARLGRKWGESNSKHHIHSKPTSKSTISHLSWPS